MFTELSLKQLALSESVLDSKLWDLFPSRRKDRHNFSAADIAVVIKPATRTWSRHAAKIWQRYATHGRLSVNLMKTDNLEECSREVKILKCL
jgi:hypothetical protein